MKTILITGATGAIGAAVCEFLASQGHALILTARDEAKLKAHATTLEAKHKVNVKYAVSDFSDTATFSQLLKLAEPGIHGLVIMPPQPAQTTECLPDNSVWENLFKASFIGPVALIKQLIPVLKKCSGSTVVISGISSKQPMSKYATANVLRTAWLGQVKTMADTYGEQGLRFNALSLGGVITDKLLKKIEKETQEKGIDIATAFTERYANVPLRRYADVSEVAEMVDFFLNSKASLHLTGQNIPFDGGYTRSY